MGGFGDDGDRGDALFGAEEDGRAVEWQVGSVWADIEGRGKWVFAWSVKGFV